MSYLPLSSHTKKKEKTRTQLMGYLKLFIFSILFFLLLSKIRAVSGREEDVVVDEVPDSALELELEQLKSKISVLAKVWESKSKEDSTAEMERTIWEKSVSIASLQKEIELLREKGAVDTEEMVGKAHARVGELEKQIERLKSEVQLQSHKRDALESRANEAEKKVDVLDLSLESLQKIHEEQKRRIKKAESALQVAKEGMKKAELEVTSKKNELKKVHGAWLPPWLATHWVYCQDVVATHWNKHGEPTLHSFLQKASHISVQVHKQIEPHLENAKSKWIPALKEHWMAFVTHIEPFVRLASTKIVEVFDASVTILAPHVVRAKESAKPYFQEAKKCSKYYIDRVATATKPHVEKVGVALKPNSKRVIYAYEEFLKSARTYHHQIGDAVQEKLRNHESTKALATEEFGWLVASALLASPVFFLYRLFLSIFCKKARKPARNAHRRPKRRQPDK